MLASLLATACRNPAPAGSATPPNPELAEPSARETLAGVRPTACSLIGPEEMSRILGGEVVQRGEDREDSSSCTYTPASGEKIAPFAEVQLSWQGGEGAMLGMRLAGDLMGGEKGFGMEKLAGLGDEATIMIGGLLYVRRGDAFFTVDLRMQEGNREKGVAIARRVLAGMPGKQ